MYFNPIHLGRVVLTLGLVLLYFHLLSKTVSAPLIPHWTLVLDDFHLIMHEAGHFILIPFSSSKGMNIGQLVYVLGGSLLQWLVPIMFISYFAFKKNIFAFFVTLFWLGHSFLNSVPYIADAKKMKLPLLGGDSVLHDWNYILRYLGVLELTEIIAYIVYALALIILTISTAGCIISAAWPIAYPNKEDQRYRQLFK